MSQTDAWSPSIRKPSKRFTIALWFLSTGTSSFLCSCTHFKGHYISYISDAGNTAILLVTKVGTGLTEDNLLSFQSLGPFSLSNRDHMSVFAELMVIFNIDQTRDTDVGCAMIEQLLG